MIKVTILKDITPKGWISIFWQHRSRIEYDSKRSTSKKQHALIYQQGPSYGQVRDMCAYLGHQELLQLEVDGLIRIEGKHKA